MPHKPRLELYELYKNYPKEPLRADIEESKNLAGKRPDKAEEMEKELLNALNYPVMISKSCIKVNVKSA